MRIQPSLPYMRRNAMVFPSSEMLNHCPPWSAESGTGRMANEAASFATTTRTVGNDAASSRNEQSAVTYRIRVLYCRASYAVNHVARQSCEVREVFARHG